MEFPFGLQRFLSESEQSNGLGIALYNAARLNSLPTALKERLSVVIDDLGEASAVAQELKKVITSSSKLSGSDDRLYLAVEGQNVATGLLRVGKKRLFIRDEFGEISEITPLCCLDFYVHESCQRKGIGKTLFDFMLQNEGAEALALGYDRPSHKLLSFLKKHFRLQSFVQQANSFVVFKDYFSSKANDSSSRSNGRHRDSSSMSYSGPAHHKISRSPRNDSVSTSRSEYTGSCDLVSRRNANLSVSHVFPSAQDLRDDSDGYSHRNRRKGMKECDLNDRSVGSVSAPPCSSNVRGIIRREQVALERQFQDCDIFGQPLRHGANIPPPSRGRTSLSRAGYATVGVASSARDRKGFGDYADLKTPRVNNSNFNDESPYGTKRDNEYPSSRSSKQHERELDPEFFEDDYSHSRAEFSSKYESSGSKNDSLASLVTSAVRSGQTSSRATADEYSNESSKLRQPPVFQNKNRKKWEVNTLPSSFPSRR